MIFAHFLTRHFRSLWRVVFEHVVSNLAWRVKVVWRTSSFALPVAKSSHPPSVKRQRLPYSLKFWSADILTPRNFYTPPWYGEVCSGSVFFPSLYLHFCHFWSRSLTPGNSIFPRPTGRLCWIGAASFRDEIFMIFFLSANEYIYSITKRNIRVIRNIWGCFEKIVLHLHSLKSIKTYLIILL